MVDDKQLRSVNPEQMYSVIRGALTFAGGYFVAKGYVTKDDLSKVMTSLDVLVPAVVALGAVIWGIVSRTDTQMIKAAADVPAVKAVTVQQPVVIGDNSLTDHPKVSSTFV